MRLYLVRHGQTSWNTIGRAQGHTDIPLDPVGIYQATNLRHAFEGVRVDRILTSDLTRCLETAQPIAKATGTALEPRKDLRERGFGQWEGLMFNEVSALLASEAETAGITAQQVRPPGGESFDDVWKRLDAVVELLLATRDHIVVVSHGGALSLLLAKLIRGTLDTSRAFRFSNTGVTELQRRADGLFLMNRYSDTAHLATDNVLSGGAEGVSR